MTRLPAILTMAVLCLSLLIAGGSVVAQEIPQRGPLPAPVERAPAKPTPAKPQAANKAAPAKPGQTAPAQVRVIPLTLNKAELVTLPRAIGKIVVGNETVADVHFDPVQPTKVYILSKAIGSTNVFFLDKRGETIEQVDVRVMFDEKGINEAIKQLLPDEYITVSVFRDSVFLTGKVRTSTAARDAVSIVRRFVAADANVTNMLSVVGGQQVILQVRVAEMDRDIRKNLAFNASFIKDLHTPVIGGIKFTTSSPSPTVAAFASGRLFTGTNVFGDPTFTTLERQNLTKTLAEPTLTAISGETATFLSGGEFPFPSGLDQNGQVIFEFRKFGISLNFTPTVIDEGRMSLQISVEVSAIDTANSLTITSGGTTTTVPGLSIKNTDTTVDLPSGGALMISGLLKDNVADTISGFPYLKDVPVLGTLFRSTQFQRQETELVVLVTAYLVKPVDKAASLSLPTDGFEPASDIDIYLLGRLHRHYTKGERSLWADPLRGPFGYIMK